MLLKHAREPIDGQGIENTFEAIDERTGALLASCVIYTHVNEALYPTRPLRIYLGIEGDEVPDILLGAAVARAKGIAHESAMPARIFTEVEPDNRELMELLQMHGFADNDGLVLMRLEVEDAEDYRLPAGCVTVMDDLDDPIEQKYFLDRYNMTYNEQFDFEWLANFRKKSGFKRILIVSPTGMVGETVRGSVRIASGCIAETLGKAAWQITAEPQHGTVSINADGVYRYVPDEGFEGVDRFTVVLAAPYASSEPLEVSVQIGDVTETTSQPDETSSELSETREPSERTSALPWILAGVGALAAIAAAVAVFLKKKRK